MSDEIGYLVEEISLTVIHKRKNRGIVKHKELEPEVFKYSQPIHVVKSEVVCSKENTKCIAEQTFHEKKSWVL